MLMHTWTHAPNSANMCRNTSVGEPVSGFSSSNVPSTVSESLYVYSKKFLFVFIHWSNIISVVDE